MNKQQRNQWDNVVTHWAHNNLKYEMDSELIIAANAYIMKLERELQKLKGGRKIAAILKSKVSV